MARRISRLVGLGYYLGALIVFRTVLFSLPDLMAGRSVLVGDELVPFFNPTSQLFDQAAGQFSPLTNGYEFRVRYSFLTTWLRHYQVLPFAVLFVIPTIFWVVYLAVASFMDRVFKALSPVSIRLAVAFPTTLLYLIATYAKITHFYTLVLGLAMATVAVLLMLYAILFADRWLRYAFAACLVVLLNPAVHYLVLFVVFYAVMAVTLTLGELALWVRSGGVFRLKRLAPLLVRLARSRRRVRLLRRAIRIWAGGTIGRTVVGGVVLVFATVVPYALFVKYVALAGVENLSETVPGDYYFIRDASVSWLHVLSFDLAGIMDKILFGDYLAKVPRVPNVAYSVLLLAPLVIGAIRRVFATRAHRQLRGVIYVLLAFAMWATIGYAEPIWFPTFHRSLATVTSKLYATDTPVGELALSAASTVVQVLRFPHRFQLLIFILAPLPMSVALAAWVDSVGGWFTRRSHSSRARRRRGPLRARLIAATVVASFFFTPFWANEPYRRVFGSGDFADFLSPFPVGDLQEVKQVLLGLDEGPVVVLPPTETAKLTTSAEGINHKFIDKFFIYYVDEPSFYYGLTGDARNKFEFFLILRGIYYQQDWWINPARDIGIRYIIVNKGLRDNGGIGAEYLPSVEDFTRPGLDRLDEYVELRFENEGYALYELIDQPEPVREILLIDSSWTDYLELVFDRLDLSRCYDFEYIPYYHPDPADNREMVLYTRHPELAAVDLYSVETPGSFFTPTPKIFPFEPDIVASSYYLSPMFRLFLFFSDTKWNRTEVITPGLFGTLRGSFIGVPRAVSFTIPIKLPEDGRYRLLLRSAATANQIRVSAGSLDYERSWEMRSSEDDVQIYDRDTVYDADRVPERTAGLSVGDLEARIGTDLVPLNVMYSYQDLGVVSGSAGTHTLDFDKLDNNPMLVEGVVVVPESEYQTLGFGDDVKVVSSPDELRCGTRYEVFGPNSEGYVDPAAGNANLDLSNDELISLAAAGVPELEPDESGGLGRSPVVLATGALLLYAAFSFVRSHARRSEAGLFGAPPVGRHERNGDP